MGRLWSGLHLLLAVLLAGFVYWSQQLDSPRLDQGGRPLDRLTSVRTAFSLARLSRFDEAGWLEDQAQNVSHLSYLDTFDDELVVAKPLVVNLTIRTRADISRYTAKTPQTIASLAQLYLVSEDSLRWSNGLSGNLVPAGTTILIPPPGLNGIVYLVDDQDSLDSLVEHYQFEPDQLIVFNDIVDGQLPAGELIFIPNGKPKVRFRQLPPALAFAITGSYGEAVIGATPGCHGCRPVDAGEVIGKVGNTGWSTGPHLHLEIYDNQGRRYDPEVYIRRQGLVWPVTGGRISQYYYIHHQALDVAAKEGTPLTATASGMIIHRGCVWRHHPRWATFGVIIDHGSWYSLSVHLQAPDNPKYKDCNRNLRTSYGVKSIDYDTLE